MNNEGSISQHTAGKLFTRDFVLVFAAFFVFQAAYLALVPALPIYFTKLGSKESEVGVLIGIMGIAALVSRFIVGAILTRYSEKRVMLIGVTLSALALLASIVFRPFWPFFVVRVVQGIAFASAHTAAFTYAVKTISMAHRGQGLAYFTLSTFLAMAVAAPFGMFLVNCYNFTVFFLTFASLCVCSFLLLWIMKEQKTIGVLEQNIQSHNTTLIEWKVVVPGISAFLQMFVYGALAAFFPLYALQCGVTNPGLFFTAIGVVTVASRAFGGRILDTYDKEKMIATLILIMMVAMVVISFSKNLPMFIFVGLLYGAGMAFFMPASMVHAFEYSGSSGGPAVATFNASFDLGVALGPAVMGLIVPLTGYPVMFLSLALICFINLCYFQFYVRKRRDVAPTC
jgi:predicted MFS family arabinose efflux permease